MSGSQSMFCGFWRTLPSIKLVPRKGLILAGYAVGILRYIGSNGKVIPLFYTPDGIAAQTTPQTILLNRIRYNMRRAGNRTVQCRLSEHRRAAYPATEDTSSATGQTAYMMLSWIATCDASGHMAAQMLTQAEFLYKYQWHTTKEACLIT
jgi:hypothetical protein